MDQTGGEGRYAECGGFLYLLEQITCRDGERWPLVGVLPGESYPTDSLQRFGYLSLIAETDSLLFRAGESPPAHEFHYWEASQPGDGLCAVKPSGKTWRCAYATPSLYAGFPHLHLAGELPLARRFVEAAFHYKEHGTWT